MSETKKNENTNETSKKGKENKGFSKAETLGGMAAAAGLGVAGTMAAQAINKDEVDDEEILNAAGSGENGSATAQEEEPVMEEDPILTVEEINEIRIEPEEPEIEIADIDPTPITGLDEILPEIDITQPIDDNLYADVIIEPGKEEPSDIYEPEPDPDVIDIYDPSQIDVTELTDIITDNELFANNIEEETDIYYNGLGNYTPENEDNLLASNEDPDLDLLGDIIV